MTGIRLWIGSISVLGVVVRMVHVSSSPPSGACHTSHSPANDSSPPSAAWMCIGCLRPSVACHS
jgi:hypothetical protein